MQRFCHKGHGVVRAHCATLAPAQAQSHDSVHLAYADGCIEPCFLMPAIRIAHFWSFFFLAVFFD